MFYFLTERHDNYKFPYKYSHPDELFYNPTDAQDNDLDTSDDPRSYRSIQRRKLNHFTENSMSYFASSKTRFIRSVIDRQTAERFQTVRKRCRRTVRRNCQTQVVSRVYKTNRRISSSSPYFSGSMKNLRFLS